MTKQTKRFLVMLLSAVMLLTLLPLAAAEETAAGAGHRDELPSLHIRYYDGGKPVLAGESVAEYNPGSAVQLAAPPANTAGRNPVFLGWKLRGRAAADLKDQAANVIHNDPEKAAAVQPLLEQAGTVLTFGGEDLVFTAVWATGASTFTVTYDPNGGAWDGDAGKKVFSALLMNAPAPAVEEPVREGYRFAGWAPAAAETVTGDLLRSAQWKREEAAYTVNYYKDSAEADNLLGVDTGSGAIDDAIPCADGRYLPAGYAAPGAVSGQTVITGDASANILNVVYGRDSFGYTVRYYADSIDDANLLAAEEGIGLYGEAIPVDAAKRAPAGYLAAGEVSGAAAITEDAAANAVSVVYSKDSFNYVVNSYTDSIDAANLIGTDVGTGLYGDPIPCDAAKYAPAGYVTPGEVSGEATITENAASNVLNVVYMRDSFGYTVNYYADSINAANLLGTEAGTGLYGEAIPADAAQYVPAGYAVPGEVSGQATVTDNAESNVLNVIYSKASFAYTVNYYTDSIDAANLIHADTGTGVYGDAIPCTNGAYVPEGYTAPGAAAGRDTITEDAAGNVVNVVYSRRTDLSYTVNCYLLGTTEPVAEARTVPGQTFGAAVTEAAPLLDGYTLAACEPADGSLILGVDGNEISFYYYQNIEVRANDKTKACGAQEPALDAVITPEAEPDYVLTRAPGELIGTYAITPSGREIQGAWRVTYVPAVFTITDEGDIPGSVTHPQGIYKPGDTVTFTLSATNCYNQTVQLAFEAPAGVTVEKAEFRNVKPGATVSTTAAYTIGEQDILNGKYTNEITIRIGDKATVRTDEVELAPGAAALAVAEAAGAGKDLKAGQTVTYTIRVENTGNLTVSGVCVTDDRQNLTQTGDWSAFDLAPGAARTLTAAYTLTQADIDSGAALESAVTAAGRDPLGADVTGTASVTVTPEAARPVLTLGMNARGLDDAYVRALKLGDRVMYTVTVANAGNVTLTDVAIEPAMSNGAVPVFDQALTGIALAPGEVYETCAVYALTQADLDARMPIICTAAASGKGVQEDPAAPAPAHADVIPEADKPALALSQTVIGLDGADVNALQAGDRVRYTVSVSNTGNVTLTDVAVEPAMSNGAALTFEQALTGITLAPGEAWEAAAEYTVTQADIDAQKKLSCTAAAAGRGPQNDPKAPNPVRTDVIPASKAPALTLTGTLAGTDGADPAALRVGETVTFTVAVQNTGSVTLKGITLSGLMSNGAALALGRAPGEIMLMPGEACAFTAAYTLTQADFDAQTAIQAVAAAQGFDPQGAPVEASCAQAAAPGTASPSVALTLTVTGAPGNGSFYQLGEAIAFELLVTNTGDVTLEELLLAGVCPSLELAPEPLAVGGSFTAAGTCVVTAEDVLRIAAGDSIGHVLAEAAVTGLSRSGEPVQAAAAAKVPAGQYYTVRFIDMTGDIVHEEQVYLGGSAEPAAQPVHPGWTFLDWNGGSLTGVTADQTLYARYRSDEKAVPAD